MVLINSKQMIFTRVEEAYSPTRVSGYQVVYASPGISEADNGLVKNLVKCYKPRDNNSQLVRRQFFVLPDGVCVLTSSKIISSHPAIIDRDKRGGVFLAHCLLIDRKELAKIHYNPFPIFEVFPFICDAEAMVAGFNQRENRELSGQIAIDETRVPANAARWVSDACTIISMGEQVLLEKQPWLFIYGMDSDIHSLLNAMYWFMPEEKRIHLTFDTHIDGCQISNGVFRLLGATTRQDGFTRQINIANHLDAQVKNTLDLRDFYFAWLHNAIQKPDDQVISQIASIQKLSKALADHRGLASSELDLLDDETISSFFTLHREKLLADFTIPLAVAISDSVATSFVRYLLTIDFEKKHFLSMAISRTINPNVIVPKLRDWFLSLSPTYNELRNNDWKRLAEFAASCHDMLLLFWIGALRDDKKMRVRALEQLQPEDFLVAMELIFTPISAHLYVCAKHITSLMEYVRANLDQLSDEQFVELVQAFINIEAEIFLGDFSERIPSLGNDGLTQLEKTIHKDKNIPIKFMKQLEQRRAELGTPAGITGWISSKLGLGPKSTE